MTQLSFDDWNEAQGASAGDDARKRVPSPQVRTDSSPTESVRDDVEEHSLESMPDPGPESAQDAEPTSRAPQPGATETHSGAVKRVFLGWDAPAVESAAAWLFAQHGANQGQLVVALPGAHAVRSLQECCARQAPADWAPPSFLTQGALIDRLVQLDAPLAGRLVRTLAWERALSELDAVDRARLLRSSEAHVQNPNEALRLTETIRTLHGELAPEGVDFARVTRGRARPEIDVEAQRWEALAAAQAAYRSLLRRFGLRDPHDARRKAIHEGKLDPHAQVVLVGVVDRNALLGRLLEALGERVTTLVIAPEEEQECFDELGRLRADHWRDMELAIPLDAWLVAEKPADQADAAMRAMAAWDGGFATNEVRVGVADESVVPFLERRLEQSAVRARHAAGTSIVRSRPYRLLRAVGRYLQRGDFADLAALARDVDLLAALGRGPSAAAALDAYHAEHLPANGRGDWADSDDRHSRVEAVRSLQRGLDNLLGPLAREAPLVTPDWARPLRDFLSNVYREPLDAEDLSQREQAEALAAFGSALGELEEVPRELGARPRSAATAIDLLLRAVRNDRLPPAPAAPEEDVVELLGWLDLALDPAPALVVTGFNEGHVPQSSEGHAFLPDTVRGRLGLPGPGDRLARDAYATRVLLASKRALTFVTGRRSAEGDPLVPSRLAFQLPEEELPRRVRHFLGDEEVTTIGTRLEDDERSFACPLLEQHETPTHMSVSSFRTYLSSPYQFYLERVLKLRTIDDRARELDPLRFGTLAHDVLEHFGEHGPKDSVDERTIARFLADDVDQEVRQRFGASPLPAVSLQAEQLKRRFATFARAQAARRNAGWSIHAVEWEPQPAGDGLTGVRLDVDGVDVELRGKIDRIDVHPEEGWAVWDYKTSEKQEPPDKTHRRSDGTWKDLQLPLYAYLARELGFEGMPRLGYATLGKEIGQIGFHEARWSEQDLEHALETARDVVRAVRAGAFEATGPAPYGDIFQAIWGVGMVAAPRGDEEVEA